MDQIFVLKHIAECPYCGKSLVIDAARGKVIYSAPSLRESSRPCPHLTCFWVLLDVQRRRPNDWHSTADNEHSASLLWEHGRGIYRVNSRLHPEHAELTHYLCDYSVKNIPRQLRITSPHEFVGAIADFREAVEPGAARFVLGRKGGDILVAALDSFVIFAPRPAQVMTEIRGLIRGYER